VFPDSRRDIHWDRARKKFRLAGDDVYDDDKADQWAEQEMLTEAFGHWDEAGRLRRGRALRYRWWNAIRLRDLDTERRLSLLEMGLLLEDQFCGEQEATDEAAGEQAKSESPTARRRIRAPIVSPHTSILIDPSPERLIVGSCRNGGSSDLGW
jgi:hypothetical protein